MNSFTPLPEGLDAERVRAQYRDHVNAGYARLASMMNLPIEVGAEGVYLYDMDGNRYLDAGGYGVFLLGHSHPQVVEQPQRGSGEVAQLRMRALGLELRHDHDGDDDLVLVEAQQCVRIRQQDGGVEDESAAFGLA